MSLLVTMHDAVSGKVSSAARDARGIMMGE